MYSRALGARSAWLWLSLAVTTAAPLAVHGQVVYSGTSAGSIIVFGDTGYGGAPNNGAPTYIANNATGRNDILSSPAGGFLTANPVVANNIASYSYLAFAPGKFVGAFQVGGANANGTFGSGTVNNYGSAIAFNLGDSAPGGGSASYSITSWTANYTNGANAIPVGTRYGNLIGIGGTLQAVGSAVAVAMRTFVTSPNAGDPFFGGVDLPQLVLAFSGGGTGKALGGPGGNTAGLLFNGLSYRGVAINSIPLTAAIPAGDALSVTTTVTVIADPADLSALDVSDVQLDSSLYNAAGAPPLPSVDFALSSVPEPGSLALLGVAGMVAVWRRRTSGI